MARPSHKSFNGILATIAVFISVFVVTMWWTRPTPSEVGVPQNVDAQSRLAKTSSIDRHYSGCGAARADGRYNIPASDPGYREFMDGDGDGFACEPYRRSW